MITFVMGLTAAGGLAVLGLLVATRNPVLERRAKTLASANARLTATLAEIAAYADQGKDAVPELQAVSDIIDGRNARQLAEGNSTHGQ